MSFAAGDFQAVMGEGAVFMRPCALLVPAVCIALQRGKQVDFLCLLYPLF